MDRLLTTQEPTPALDLRRPFGKFAEGGSEAMHEGQLRLWDSAASDPIACAGTQGGKTNAESPWLLREIQRCAPLIRQQGSGKFIYAGPTLTLLKQQAIPSFKELFQEVEGLGRLIEGSKPYFRFSKEGLQKVLGFSDCPVTVHFAYTNDSSNLESMTACAGVWDEAGQKDNKYESYGAYNRRLKVARSTTFESVLKFAPQWWIDWYYADEGGGARFGRRMWGTTPYEWNWFKTEVVDKAGEGAPGPEGFELFNWPSWRNPRVSEASCNDELTNGMPLWQWQMMYLGIFTKPAGVIYDTFTFENNTCADFPVPAHWKKWPGVDFGSAHMGAVIVTENPETKVLFAIQETLAGNKTFAEHVTEIRKGGYALQVGAGGSHQEEGWREAFRTNGLPLDEPPVNDVKVGIGCVYGEVKTCSFVVFRSCKGLIAEFGVYSRVLDADGQPTEEIAHKSRYHRLDAVRYIVSKLRPSKHVPKVWFV
jgi:cytochrome c556